MMKRKLLLMVMTLIASAWALNASAQQTDVTATYLTNADFSSGTPIDNNICTYGKDMAANGTTYYSAQAIESWTNASSGALDQGYANSGLSGGLFAYGSTSFLGGANFVAPTQGPKGNAGNAAGLISVWGNTVQYTQDVTLPAGSYTVKFDVYNATYGSGNSSGVITTNLFGFVAGETTYYAPNNTFAIGQWSTVAVTFTLSEETAGQISMGYVGAGGGAAMPHLFVDNVKILKNETDENCTSQVSSNGWTGATDGYQGGSINTARQYGDKSVGRHIYQTVSGLDNGTYEVAIYSISQKEWNGSLGNDAGDVAYVFADGIYEFKEWINARSRAQYPGDENVGIYTISGVKVTDGTLTLGMGLAKANLTEWHHVQIKSLVRTNDLYLSDLVQLYEEHLAQAEDLVAKDMASSYKNNLQGVINTYDNVDETNWDDLKAAIVALHNAVGNEEMKTSIANYAEAKNILDAANAYDEAGKASYAADETIAAIQAAYDDGTLIAVTPEQKTAAQAALDTACKAQVQPAAGCDMTAYLVNPDFEVPTSNGQLPPGWTITIGGANCGQQNRTDTNLETGLAITNFIEAWHWSAITPGVIAQTVTALPEGTYVLECDASVCHDPLSGDGSDIIGAYLFIKSSLKTEKESLGNKRLDIQHYTVSFSHDGEGEVQFGLMATDEINANWLSADNFKVYFAGPMDLSVYETLLAEAVANFKAKESGLDATAYAHLKGLVDDLDDTYSLSADYKTAIANINTINDYADALIAAYAIDQDKKMKADVLSALQTLLNNAATISLEDMPTATSDLATATANATTSIANYAEAKDILDAANGYNEAGQASYAADETIAAIQAAYDDGTLTAVTPEQKTAAQAALVTACKAQVQPADGCDMTAYVQNWDFLNCENNNFPNWEIFKTAGASNKFGSTAVEYWNGSATGGRFDYYQNITNLPTGVYTVKAYMWNSTDNESGAPGVHGECGVYGRSSSGEEFSGVTVDTREGGIAEYVTEGIAVIDGVLRLGVKNNATMGGRWFGVDWIKLTYVRQLTAEEVEDIAKAAAVPRYNEALAAAQAIEEGSIPTTAYSNLQDVITNNTLEDGTSAEYNDAADALEEAVSDATPLIEPYAAWKPLKTAADAIVAETGNTKLQQKFAAFEAGVEAATTAGDLSQLVTLAQSLLDAYNDWMALKGEADILKAVANDNADANTAFKNAINTQTAAAVSALDEANPVQAIAKVQAATAALKGAMTTYVTVANPVDDAQFDLTWMLTNPDLTGLPNRKPAAGWFTDQTISGQNSQVMSENASIAYSGDPTMFTMYEYWSGNREATEGYVVYLMATLPAGTYEMDALCLTGYGYATRYENEADRNTNVTFSAGEDESAVDGTQITTATLEPATLQFIQKEAGEVKIGLKAHAGNTSNWMGIGYVKLYKLPVINEAYPIVATIADAVDAKITVENVEVEEALPTESVVITIDDKGYAYDLVVTDGENQPIVPINLGEGAYSFQMPKDKVNVTVSTFTDNVNLAINSAAKWGTFMSTFDFPIDDDFKAYTIEGVDADGFTLILTPVEGTVIPANTPVVVESLVEADVSKSISDLRTKADSYTFGLLTGVIEPTVPEEGSYVMQKKAEGVNFYRVPEGFTKPVPAFRAYLKASSNEINVFYFPGEEGGVTAIEGFDALTSGEFDAIYTASGVKVDALQKGLNIVVKGDKSYKIYVK